MTEKYISRDWIRAARIHAQISQRELASRLGVATKTITARETGRYRTTWETWLATLSVLGLPLEWQPTIDDGVGE